MSQGQHRCTVGFESMFSDSDWASWTALSPMMINKDSMSVFPRIYTNK